MPNGAALFLSDPVPFQAFGYSDGIPASTPIFIKESILVRAGQNWPYVGQFWTYTNDTGESCQTNNKPQSQVSVMGPLTGGTDFTGQGPLLCVCGAFTAPETSILIGGDFIFFGSTDTISSGRNGTTGGVAVRAAWNVNGRNIPWINIAVSGTKASQLAPSLTKRRALAAYADHFVYNSATNDLIADSAATVLANLQTVWAGFAVAGAGGAVKVYQELVIPRVTCTNQCDTLVDQAVSGAFVVGGARDTLNADIIANVGSNNLTGYADLNTTLQDPFATASWVVNGSPGYSTTDGVHPGGTNGQLLGAQVLSSLYGTFAAISTHDYNGDGYSDIAWRDTSGNTAVWLMNGARVLSSGGFSAVPTVWSIVGQRDFDGDGRADIVWQDTSGNVAMWLMKGTQVSLSAGLGNVPTTWSIVGTGDFNGDGKGDILWRDTSGNVAVWLMNGAQLSQSAGLGSAPTVWSIVETGDFNGDGKSDVLWHDISGNVAIWFMNGTQASSVGVGNVSTAWSIVGTGDFDGDGKSDILWRDTSGNVAVWLMNGAQLLQSAGLGSAPTVWSIVETGDFNGDGKSDVLWHDTSGNVAIWFMNGTQASSVGVGNVSTAWSIQGANAD